MSFLALGPHIFERIGVNPQKKNTKTLANWPAVPRFGGPAARQFTGEGEHSFKINGLVFDAALGGYDDYQAIRRTQLSGRPVPMISLSAGMVGSVFGLVCILDVSDEEDYLGDGFIGQRLQFDIEVAPFGDEGPYRGGLF